MATEPQAATKSLATRVEQSRALLVQAVENHAPVVLASAMGAEDMVLIDQVASDGLPVEIFVLDTGRLHRETLSLITETRERYSIAIKIHHPKAEAVAAYVRDHGRDGFYDSIEARKTCCGIRKVEPLGRALTGLDGWITGLRRGQGPTRARIAKADHDGNHGGILKLNPIADWTGDQVRDYLREHQIPRHPLHDRGYPSIGCAPCTRAVRPGEDLRAGRWWWEKPDTKECGLH